MSDLFDDHIQRHKMLEELSTKLLRLSSVLGLHAWYKSEGAVLEPTLSAAADDAEEAALILIGKTK